MKIMSTDLIPSPARELSPEQQNSTPLSAERIMLAMLDLAKTDVDVGKINALTTFYREQQAFDAKRAYAAAMHTVQETMQAVAKRHYNDQKKNWYANYDDIAAALEPVAHANGFSWKIDNPEMKDGLMHFVITVAHTAGHEDQTHFFAPPDGAGAKGGGVMSAIQGHVSSNTYAERVLICNAFAIKLKDKDKDGEKPARLSDDELGKLEAMVQESGITEAGLKNMLAVGGVTKLEDVKPGAQYAGVYEALRMKLAARRQA
jgi:hypothetical protein